MQLRDRRPEGDPQPAPRGGAGGSIGSFTHPGERRTLARLRTCPACKVNQAQPFGANDLKWEIRGKRGTLDLTSDFGNCAGRPRRE